MKPASYTAESDASQPQQSDGIPVAIKLLICFLFLQGAEAVVELARPTTSWVGEPGPTGWGHIERWRATPEDSPTDSLTVPSDRPEPLQRPPAGE